MAWCGVVVANGFVKEIREFKSPRHICNVPNHFVIDEVAKSDKGSSNGNRGRDAVENPDVGSLRYFFGENKKCNENCDGCTMAGQTARDYTLLLNTGQILSIPLVIAGVYLMVKSTKTSTNEA